MGEPSPILRTEQIADLVRDFFRLKSRLPLGVPADLARLKEQLGEQLHPEGGPRRVADFDLFYRVGIVLARSEEPPTMGEITEALAVPPSTATRMVDWLVDNGYAQRLPDPEDRRIVRVALTEVGQALYQKITEFVRRRAEQLFSRLTGEERIQFIRLLKKLAQGLEELEG